MPTFHFSFSFLEPIVITLPPKFNIPFFILYFSHIIFFISSAAYPFAIAPKSNFMSLSKNLIVLFSLLRTTFL